MLVLVACVAQFLVVLDVSIVNVALPSMEVALGLDKAGAQWVVNAYVLVFAGFLLVGGRLADLLGLRGVFLAGLVVFTAASLIGGAATDAAVVIASRAGQGLGAAVLAPATVTMLTTTVPEGPRRHRALAVWTAVGLAGGTMGNLVGGLLTEFLSWRWVFLGNVPAGILALLLGLRALPRGHTPRRRRPVDLPGAVLATSGLSALAYAVVRWGSPGGNSPSTWVALAVAAGAFAAFAVVEVRFARVPLLPPSLLGIRSVVRGNVVLLLVGACLNPMWYFLTFTMRDVLGFGPLLTGLGFLPHTVLTIVVGVWLTPKLMRVVEPRTLVVTGAAVAAAGFAWQSGLDAGTEYLAGILGPAILISLGGGLLNTPVTVLATSGVPADDAGAASGLLNTTKQVGGALGLAALVAVSGSASHGGTPIAEGYALAFLIMAVLLVATACYALLLPRSVSVATAGGVRARVADDRRG
ncbi:MFS transporter [Saccharomonospora xinjiangensis]|uniref:Arabinose efflux permease family protein n=1 Tax=Saccharomonospora xinjiangensis XJ-54 TaxID=882086 RepID=I0V5U1_9PSEU|nr:MFS transporter [Saccharomonospora xinjiangensis]EID55494.1 arabinose efflux permease family protein [Saccharomonospora xinjiangensis XJ-54]QBQ61525.1 putative MFS-type transporter EfpA [Saccharomonospora xinjiangensis]